MLIQHLWSFEPLFSTNFWVFLYFSFSLGKVNCKKWILMIFFSSFYSVLGLLRNKQVTILDIFSEFCENCMLNFVQFQRFLQFAPKKKYTPQNFIQFLKFEFFLVTIYEGLKKCEIGLLSTVFGPSKPYPNVGAQFNNTAYCSPNIKFQHHKPVFKSVTGLNTVFQPILTCFIS